MTFKIGNISKSLKKKTAFWIRRDRLLIRSGIGKQHYFTVKGMRGSGTNFLRSLWEQVHYGLYVEPYWKHTFMPDEINYYTSHNIKVIGVYKDLHSWLLSLYRYRWHMPHAKSQTFDEFIRSPCYSIVENKTLEIATGLPRGSEFDRYTNPVDMYYSKLRVFSAYCDKLYDYVMLLKTGKAVEELSSKFIHTQFMFDDKKRQYYLDREYMNEYSPEQLEFINEQIQLFS